MPKVFVMMLVVLHTVLSLLSTSRAFFSEISLTKRPLAVFSYPFRKQRVVPVIPSTICNEKRKNSLYMSGSKEKRQQENTLYQEVVEKMLYDNPRATSASGSGTTKVTSSSKEIQFGKYSFCAMEMMRVDYTIFLS